MIALWIILGIALNELVAYCILDAIDDEQHLLRNWIFSCPIPGGSTLATQLWPLTAWLWLRRRKSAVNVAA